MESTYRHHDVQARVRCLIKNGQSNTVGADGLSPFSRNLALFAVVVLFKDEIYSSVRP
jgi:hypothetical protein